ncbi:MAG: hypothetical protein LBT26_03310 [Clostridiales Family XIII bacterium]|jgi:hypothetical protein|nr:hypothetical protein [Clostridiales Family XIII bacterium]
MVKTYNIIYQDQAIGVFTETYADYEVTLHIQMDKTLEKAKFPASLYVLVDDNYEIENELAWVWLDSRIIPSTRINIESNLKAMGLSEYDPLAIFHWTKGRCTADKAYLELAPVPDAG